MALPLPLSLAIAYLTNRRRQTVISITGVAMGVGFFIAVSAMMQGFHQYFIDKIIHVAPHVVMKDEFRTPERQPLAARYPHDMLVLSGVKPKDERRGIRGGERIAKGIARIPGISSVSPVLRGQVFLHYGGKDLAVNMMGIDLAAEARTSNIEKDMVEGALNNLNTNSNGIIIGFGTASNLGAKLGSKLTVVSPQNVTLVMKVEGITRTGITELDYGQAYALLEKSQILQKRDNRINLIKMRLADVNQAAAIATQLEARYGWRTEGWQETNENIFSLFRLEEVIMQSVVTAILIVAGFGIFNIITTVVHEKERDIAILRSMGLSRRDIELIFLFQGIIVGILGTLLGWMLGWLLMWLLEQVPINMTKELFMEIQHMILYRTPWHYITSGILAIIAASVSALLPARRAARLRPVDIIRSAA